MPAELIKLKQQWTDAVTVEGRGESPEQDEYSDDHAEAEFEVEVETGTGTDIGVTGDERAEERVQGDSADRNILISPSRGE